jgi:hypothetical protein
MATSKMSEKSGLALIKSSKAHNQLKKVQKQPATVHDTIWSSVADSKTDDSESNNKSLKKVAVTTSLPSWVAIGWKRQYLLMLYAALAKSTEPFLHFAKGSNKLLTTIQQTLNSVYPMAKHKVVPGDIIYETVSDQHFVTLLSDHLF